MKIYPAPEPLKNWRIQPLSPKRRRSNCYRLLPDFRGATGEVPGIHEFRGPGRTLRVAGRGPVTFDSGLKIVMLGDHPSERNPHVQKKLIALTSSAVLAALVGCAQHEVDSADTGNAANKTVATADRSAEIAEDNVLLAEWTGPYGGVPAFDKAELSDLKPALKQGMAMALAEVDAIADNPAEPTFENTIVALDGSGEALNRVFTYWGIWSGNMSSPEFREIQQEMAPELSAFNSKITQNSKLFQRVKTVYEGDEMETLRPDQQRLTWLTYNGFARNGATLEGEARERYAAINQRLAELHTQFANNVLADEEGYVLYLNADQLDGLPKSLVTAAAAAAEQRDHAGQYAITNTRSSMDPFLTYSDERDLREKVWRTYYSRGDNGDEHDNNAIIAEILQLRDERVGLTTRELARILEERDDR